MPARTPGRSGMWTRRRCSSPGSGYSRSSIRRRLPAASAIQRASEPGVARLRARPRAARRGAGGRRAPLCSALGVVEEDVDPDARVRAGHAGHVAERPSRRCERLVAVDASRSRLIDEHVCEHVRKVARQRDEPIVRARVDGDRRRAEARLRSRARAGSARDRSRAAVTRNQVAPSNRFALACSAPRASEPQTGWPPMKRGDAGCRGADRLLRRADVRHGARLRCSLEHRTRPAWRAGRRAPRRRRARPRRAPPRATRLRSSTAPRSTAVASMARRRRSRRPRVPSLRLAARATEAPISPVPTMASRLTAISDLDSERASRRASARPRGRRGRATVARSAAGRRATCSRRFSSSSSTASEPPRHSVTSSPVNSRWTPPGQTTSSWQAAKKPSISSMITSKRRVLIPDAVLKTLACIGSQAQTTGCSASATAREERRQELADAVGAHARDQRQPAGNALGVEPLAELDDLFGRRRRADLAPERVVDTGEELDVRAVELARALADPEHVRGAVVPVARRRVAPRQPFLVVEHEALVARPDVDLVQRLRVVEVDADRGHEAKRALDLRGDSLVALPLGRATRRTPGSTCARGSGRRSRPS